MYDKMSVRRLLKGRRPVPRVTRTAKMFACSPVIAHSLVRRCEQTGISFDAHD